MQKNIIYQGNSVISVETHPEYSHPVVIKKPYKRHPSRRSPRSLEKEYEMTRSLNAVEGVRKALGQQSIENQPALILEYIDGETLRDHIGRKTLSLRAKLEIAVDLTRILGKIHEQDVVRLDLNSKNILIGNKQGAVHLIDLGDDQDGKSGGGFSGRGVADAYGKFPVRANSGHVGRCDMNSAWTRMFVLLVPRFL